MKLYSGDKVENPADTRSTSTPPSDETNLYLDISIASTGFLNNIIEYGKARMARRAVGILSKMPAYKEIPKQPHYTAAIWACEQGKSYELAISVFEEMKSQKINRVAKTYEALIGVAEKTGHWQEAIDFFNEMESEKIEGTTEIYNSCIWAAEQGGRYDLALQFLKKMEDRRVARDAST
jgi:pentatricopeptide repeat protein